MLRTREFIMKDSYSLDVSYEYATGSVRTQVCSVARNVRARRISASARKRRSPCTKAETEPAGGGATNTA